MRFKQPAFRVYCVDLYSQRKVIAAIDLVVSPEIGEYPVCYL